MQPESVKEKEPKALDLATQSKLKKLAALTEEFYENLKNMAPNTVNASKLPADYFEVGDKVFQITTQSPNGRTQREAASVYVDHRGNLGIYFNPAGGSERNMPVPEVEDDFEEVADRLQTRRNAICEIRDRRPARGRGCCTIA